MDFFNRKDDAATAPVTTSSAARARLRERAGELMSVKPESTTEHLSARPQRLHWSGRHQS